MFELEGVGVVAQGRTLLHPLHLSLSGQGVCGLIGHSGSGKTTLLRLLARQLQPIQGRVLVWRRELALWPGRTLAREIAYLPQHPPAAKDLLARERL